MQKSPTGSVGALDLEMSGMGDEDFPRLAKELYIMSAWT